MSIKLLDREMTEYVAEVARTHGNLSKSAALRLVVAEHREIQRRQQRAYSPEQDDHRNAQHERAAALVTA
jgi:hypothetical protein